MTSFKLTALLLFLGLLSSPVTVRAVDSASYEIDPDANFFSVHHTVDSVSFEVEGAMEPITGRNASSSYRIESGDAFSWYCGDGFIDPGEFCDTGALSGESCQSQGFDRGTLVCTSDCAEYDLSDCDNSRASGGGSGGNTFGIIPEPPRFGSPFQGPNVFTFQELLLVYGDKTESTTTVVVNGESGAVTYPTIYTWLARLTLVYGINHFVIIAHNTGGDSIPVTLDVYLRLKGDVNQDNTVDDYDLSRFVNLWGGADPNGDFNTDFTVNDYDFSIMISRWGMRV